MIINNDMVKVFRMVHYNYEKCLSHNVLHYAKFNQLTARAEYLLMWRYETNLLTHMSFRDNRHSY